MSETIQKPVHRFLEGGSKTADLIRTYDWSGTAVGPIESWPQSLKSALSICLNSGFPIAIYWGPDFTLLYNDAWSSIPGDKHPWALGKPGVVVWPEIWENIATQFQSVLTDGESIRSPDTLLPMRRFGYTEECYFDYTLSPIFDTNGHVGGIFNAVIETTYKVINERRNLFLHALVQQIRGVQTRKQGFVLGASLLADAIIDIPFSMLYEVDHTDPQTVTLKETVGLRATHHSHIDWPFERVSAEGRSIPIVDVQQRLGEIANYWPEPVTEAYIIPLKQGPHNITGFLVAGVSARKRLDDEYRHFLETVAAHISTGITYGIAHEEEVRATVQLQESESNFRNMILQAPAAMCIFKGPHYVVEIANQHMFRFWGRDEQEVINRPIFEGLPEVKDQGFEALLDQVFYHGERVSACNVPVKLPRNGTIETVYVDFLYEPLRETDNSITGVMAVATEVTQQVIARKKIEESEMRFRNLVLQAPVATAVFEGKDMVLALANDSMLNIWGRSPDIQGKRLLEFMPELANQPFPKLLEQVMDTGETYSEEGALVVLQKQGRLQNVYMDFSYTALRDHQGAVYGVQATAMDVTERIMASRRLEESEQNLRNMILQAPVAMCIFKGAAFIVEIANKNMIDLWGRSEQEVIGHPIFDALPEIKNQGFEELLQKVFYKGERIAAHSVPVILPRVQGLEKVYVDFLYEPFREGNGEITGVMAVATDVTEQVLARNKIEEAEERARLAIESADLGTFEVNLYTNEIIPSPRLSAIFGLKSTTDRKEFVNALLPDDLPLRNRAYRMARTTGILDYEGRVRWEDGSIHWMRIKGKIFYNEKNEPEKIIGVGQDITEQKLFAEELALQVQERTRALQEAYNNLEKTNADLEQFAYVASHDLQEPLRKIQVFNSMLNERVFLPEEAKKYTLKIDESSRRMTGLIRDLLEYSRVSQRGAIFQNMSLDDTLRNVLEDYEVMIAQKNAQVHYSTLGSIEAVPLQMNQLFYNLVGNALKFSRDTVQPELVITCDEPSAADILAFPALSPDEQYVRLHFRDNGIGFQQEYADKIFTIFQRLNERSMYGGYGIGLAICKKIVDLHKGLILAKGTPGQGAEFVVVLPRRQAQHADRDSGFGA